MSLYRNIIAHWIEDGKYCLDFQDDLGQESNLTFPTDAPRLYFEGHPHVRLSELEHAELFEFEQHPCASINLHPLIVRFINASFWEWIPLIEIENPN